MSKVKNILKLSFSTKRSKGVSVSDEAYRFISLGNSARDQGRWADAASAYRGSLRHDPELAHIWVQLGHAEKESGHVEEAEKAYLRASTLQPGDPEPLIHLGHIAKDMGDLNAAARRYLAAARRDPMNQNIGLELQQLLARIAPAKRAVLNEVLSEDLHLELGGAPLDAVDGPTTYIDVSDLVAQAVSGGALDEAQNAKARRVLALLEDGQVRACAHVDGHPQWLHFAPGQLRELVEPTSSLRTGQDGRLRQASRLGLELVFAHPVRFRAGDLIAPAAVEAVADHEFFLGRAQQAGARLVAFESALRTAGFGSPPVNDGGAGVTGHPALPPVVPVGCAIGLGKGCEGLRFRWSSGWLTPAAWGSWTYAGGVELCMMPPPGEGPWRLSVLLRGLPNFAGNFTIATGGETIGGRLQADEWKWVTLTIAPPAGGPLCIEFRGHEAIAVESGAGEPPLLASLGIVGLHVCHVDDHAARMNLLERVTFGGLVWT